MPRHDRLARAGSGGGTAPVTSATVGGDIPATLWTVRPIVVVAHGQMTQPRGTGDPVTRADEPMTGR